MYLAVAITWMRFTWRILEGATRLLMSEVYVRHFIFGAEASESQRDPSSLVV